MYSRPGDVPDAAALAALDHEVELGRQDEEAESAAGEVLARVGEQLRLAFGSVHDDRGAHGGEWRRKVDFAIPAIIVPPIGRE